MQTDRKNLEKSATFYADIHNSSECADKYYGGFYGSNKPNYPFEKCLTSTQPEDCKQKVYDDYQKCRGIFKRPEETRKELETNAHKNIKHRLEKIVSQQKDAFYSAPTFLTRFRITHMSKCPTAPAEDHKKCADKVYNAFKNSIPVEAAQYIPSQKEVESDFDDNNRRNQEYRQQKIEKNISDNKARNQKRCEEIFYIKHAYSSTIFGIFNQCFTASDPQKCKEEVYEQYQRCLNKA